MSEPKVGQYLFSTCSAEDYGRIVAVGKDSYDSPTIDIEVLNYEDFVHFEGTDKFDGNQTRLELSEGATLILRNVQFYRIEESIVCNTPVGGCFRCSRCFELHDGPYQPVANKPWDPLEAATRLSAFLKKELSLGMPEEYLFSLPIGFAVGQYRKHAPSEMVRRRVMVVVDAALRGAEHGLKNDDSN